MPGLVDMRAEDGREWFDLTLGQLRVIVDRERLEVVVAVHSIERSSRSQ